MTAVQPLKELTFGAIVAIRAIMDRRLSCMGKWLVSLKRKKGCLH